MTTFYWFLCGLGSALIVAAMFGVMKKKFVSLHEAMVIVMCFLFGPITMTVVILVAIARAMIEINDHPYKVLLDWRPKEHSVECPRCAFNEQVSVTVRHCPNCREALLIR